MSIKKKYLLLIIFCLAILIYSTSCTSSGGSTRDLSTPETRIVGHWGLGRTVGEYQDEWENLDPCSEIYIGELDEDSVGSYITVSLGYTTSMEPSGECEIDYDQYRVITNEYPEEILKEFSELSEYGEPVIIRFLSLEEGDETIVGWGVPIFVSEDGLKLTAIHLQGLAEFQYIDSKTEP
jgi:hypothetical protein